MVCSTGMPVCTSAPCGPRTGPRPSSTGWRWSFSQSWRTRNQSYITPLIRFSFLLLSSVPSKPGVIYLIYCQNINWGLIAAGNCPAPSSSLLAVLATHLATYQRSSTIEWLASLKMNLRSIKIHWTRILNCWRLDGIKIFHPSLNAEHERDWPGGTGSQSSQKRIISLHLICFNDNCIQPHRDLWSKEWDLYR